MNVEDRTCVECGELTEHLVTDETVHCTVCGVPADGESRSDCAIAYCSDAATHLVVLDSGRIDEQREQYCASHVGVAADDARADPARDVVVGPVELESE